MDQVGRYEILDEVGRGAHGVVYKALDPAIGRTVAIKTIDLGAIAEEDRKRVREAILREARLAGTLSHPNIVTVYDVQDTGDSARIFMEFVDGKSLEWAISSIKAHRPDALVRSEFISIIRQIAAALDYAHRKGVIHRDVKPANILLTSRTGGNGVAANEPLAKIADFGVAKFASPEATQSLTGTPNYMSPEQIQGVAVTGASDQFSLAVITYEVLTGRKAFSADRVEALLYRIRHDREEPVDKLNPSLSPTVRKVMQCALAKSPEQRFGSCSEFAGALEFALGDSPDWQPGSLGGAPVAGPSKSVVTYRSPESEPEEPQRSNKALLIAGLCLAVGLAVFLIVRMNSGPSIPVQVLETKNAPVSPPPSVEELKYDRRPPASDKAPAKPATLKSSTRTATVPAAAAPSATPSAARQTIADSGPPTVVSVPVPEPQLARSKKHRPMQASSKAVLLLSTVQLLTDPPGANILVDGLASCTTPCALELKGGRHTLAAFMQGFGITRKIFYVPSDSSLFLPLVKSLGTLVVSSDPSGAAVNLDGQSAGRTPVTLHLAPGAHRVSVWDGATWRDQEVQIGAGELYSRAFHF